MQKYHQNTPKSFFEEQYTMNELSKMGNPLESCPNVWISRCTGKNWSRFLPKRTDVRMQVAVPSTQF